MGRGYQNSITITWNRVRDWLSRRRSGARLWIGTSVEAGRLANRRVGIPSTERREHIAILGKTGSGKTSLLRYLCQQDIRAGHGFAFFDLHGDSTPHLLTLVAAEEERRGSKLDHRLVLIDPGDPERSVGLNLLQAEGVQEAYVQIAEITAILKHRWHLDALGVRTEELLRHSLFVLVSSGLTLLEISPLLTSATFRARRVDRTPPGEARTYFQSRYDKLSSEMQAVYREAILNKISLYAADPRFRHLLGQHESTVDLKEAIDSGAWILINLEKGRLGEEASTLSALLLARLKHAILGRTNRRLFSLYCDEFQNLVAYDAGIDVLLSEARKFGVGIVSANQYLDQYPVSMRAAVLAVGTHAFLQLSGIDAQRVAYWLGAGRHTADMLRDLPKRHVLVRQASGPVREAIVPDVWRPTAVPYDLLRRVRQRWTRSRAEVETMIAARHSTAVEHGRITLGDEWN